MTKSPKQICSRIGFALFFMMVTWMLASAALMALVQNWYPAFMSSPWALWLLNDIPLYGVGMPVFLLVLLTLPDGAEPARPLQRIRWWQFLLLALVCLGATYALSYVTTFVQYFIQEFLGAPMQNSLDQLVQNSGTFQNFLFGACVPAVGEEFIFRYMLRRKMKGCSDSTYMLFSGLSFAAFHGNFAQLFYAFALGVVFAWVYLRTNRLWVSMALHFLLNLFGILVLPGLVGNSRTMVLGVVLIFLLIAGGAVVFALYLRRARHSLLPATAPGWPQGLPRRQQTVLPAYAAPYPAPQPAPYAAPYATPYMAPHAAPYAAPHAGPYTAPPPAAVSQYPPGAQPYWDGQAPKPPRFWGTCVLNVGMMLYLCTALLLVIATLAIGG